MANLRLRLQPEIHVTDGIAVYTQIDALGNLVMGSTPQGYYNGAGQYGSPWAATTVLSRTQVDNGAPPIRVNRAWAEVSNPTLGQIRFGRMPWHWGLGMFANAGDGIDSDFQTHVDRIMYQFRLRSLGLFAMAMYDFASTGPTSATPRYEGGQGQVIDLGTLDDVNQYGLAVGRRIDAVDARQALARGNLVWNAGLWGTYRRQVLSLENARITDVPTQEQYIRRDAHIGFADLWFQLLHRSFRLEIEAAVQFGSMNFSATAGAHDPRVLDVFQLGGALEFEYRLLNNRLQIEFRAGFASGDPDMEGLNGHASPNGGALLRDGVRASTAFSFHPDYRVDLILWRQVFRQVSSAYYFRPGVMYAFVDRPGGDRFYGRASLIWSRASEFVQTRGNTADLGIEANAELTYISNFRDPSLSDRVAPGFFASAQYGILFPMAGLGPTQTERNSNLQNFEFSNAQTLRAVLGVFY